MAIRYLEASQRVSVRYEISQNNERDSLYLPFTPVIAIYPEIDQLDQNFRADDIKRPSFTG